VRDITEKTFNGTVFTRGMCCVSDGMNSYQRERSEALMKRFHTEEEGKLSLMAYHRWRTYRD